MPFRLGPLELGIILAIVLLLFGPGRLGNLGKDLGKSIREFREGLKGEDKEPADQDENK
ncbi:MAG: twin-arginine translocase TatA/TatE family subunit [Thermoflexales bacterium]|nr:twin-arginine translocase TatA/TatE family subunit [Thermoflexales bacterium]